ncbi:hypothetical protein QTG54_005461 [Skeletonema marinoi]|uniref:Uncharacterized protein n=1 Tax=Skeletonema marinoi TaxID=267567 RepID=A0AAD9DF49_9STRA|nr:hypothetical protein QTG54_005461 [Skeletonema marinoi]
MQKMILMRERILSRIWLLSLKNEDDFIEFIEVHLPNILNNQSHGIKPQHNNNNHQTINIQHHPLLTINPACFIKIVVRNYFNYPLLRRMSDVYDVPIVITNQVTTSIPSMMDC